MDHVYIIAEAGVNHNGDINLAKELIDKAAEAGADAVKFQMFDPEEIASADTQLAEYQEGGGHSSQLEMLKSLALPREAFAELVDYAGTKNIDCIITAYDKQSAEFIATLSVPYIKIPSGEVTNHPLLYSIAALGKSVILSTGTCNLEEVDDAVSIFKDARIPLTLLHCTSAYPTPFDQVNLRAMETLHQKFGVPVGLSDHTEGVEAPIAAVALGAVMIEKHFTLDRSLPGPDHKASLEPELLTAMVKGIRNVESALGTGEKVRQEVEEDVAKAARRSIVTCKNIAAGEEITEHMITLKRPGTGISPKEHSSVTGKKALRDIPEGTLLSYDMFE
ncbi:MAG: N-acetylneuraminate synthase [Flammeovirgaceae bacterium]|nr:N-acetylneuraminate synthase [Flammeovirgaceae bacterium]|tara:strand:- start:5334 stop:6335 length:1002 start_codon:yes stop_codon:yes gene_type:complete